MNRLTLNSYIAKAASDDREDARLSNTARLLDYGEQTLAKAATTFDTGDKLMALGEKAISDPTEMGVFASHLSTGDLAAARQMLTQVADRASFAKSVDAAQNLLEEPLADFEQRRSTSEITAKMSSLERLLDSITQRLDALERRPQVAPPAPGQQVVVKAAGGKKRSRTSADESQQLLALLDRYVDNPTLAGSISSLIQAGRFAEARPVLERAKEAHEAQEIRERRRSWGS